MEGDVEAVLHVCVPVDTDAREGVYALEWWLGVVVGGVAMGSLYTCKTPAAASTGELLYRAPSCCSLRVCLRVRARKSKVETKFSTEQNAKTYLESNSILSNSFRYVKLLISILIFDSI